MANEKVDVVIVGGGASGLMLAAKLGQVGKKVVVLEVGPPLALDDLVSSQIWSRRLKWGGVPVLSEGKNPVGHNFQSAGDWVAPPCTSSPTGRGCIPRISA